MTLQPRPLVMIVGDEIDAMRQLMGHMVARAGFDVLVAASIGKGVERSGGRIPRIVVVDMQCGMQVPDELWEDASALKRSHGTRLVMCTGDADLKAISKALDSGFDEFIVKPFDEEILLGKLRSVA